MLAIKNNLMAEQAARQLGISYDSLTKSVARLSSGLRITTAGDDAAGMAVRELIRADVAVLKQGARNGRDAISMLQTAEGAIGVIDSILIRMRELAEQSATESYSSAQRGIMHQEFSQLMQEIDRISNNTTFNGLSLLNDETYSNYKIHLGTVEMIQLDRSDMTSTGLAIANRSGQAVLDNVWTSTVAPNAYSARLTFKTTDPTVLSVAVTIDSATISLACVASTIDAATGISASVVAVAGGYTIKVTTDSKGSAYTLQTPVVDQNTSAASNDSELSAWTLRSGSNGVSINTALSAREALTTLYDAIQTKDTYRAKLGYLMNRLEAAISVIDIQAENLLAAESRISDVDVASEMAAMTRNQVLAQAGISMLSQANQIPQMALSLLQG